MIEPVFVPFQRIAEEALKGLLEDFATRDGTDYGDFELDLQAKVGLIRRQLLQGEAVIVFDPTAESLSIISMREALALGFSK
jgi:uncharacterized protein